MKRLLVAALILVASAAFVIAQDSNTSTSTRGRTATSKPSPTPTKTVTKSSDSGQTGAQTGNATGAPATGPSTAVLAAFDKIIDGIRRANVNLYMSGYWESPTLMLFNYNGTVTKGWDQLKKNRESSFPQSKEVKLDIRDRHVTMLGRDGAVVTCLWTQSQTFNGQPDSASGRMTLVFKRVGTEWKAVHLHTSPDKPDPARVPASEQTSPR
ncbi:MAG TPA: nuclear transport factor 2 family protein [Pyrinomonadaceae bacterium]|nr:nuclear transport factor 2 family protein [Pyrinomonadaceae bacterium]